MSLRVTILDTTDSKGRALFQLDEDMVYPLGPGCNIVVPKGYVSNLGTVPRWASFVISSTQMRQAAILHDYLCNEDFSPNGDLNSGFSRWFADAILYEALGRQKVSWFQRVFAFLGVRFWAWLTIKSPFGYPLAPLIVKKEK